MTSGTTWQSVRGGLRLEGEDSVVEQESVKSALRASEFALLVDAIEAKRAQMNVANSLLYESNGLSLVQDDYRLDSVRMKVFNSNRKITDREEGDMRLNRAIKPDPDQEYSRPQDHRYINPGVLNPTDAENSRRSAPIWPPTSGLLAGHPGYGYDRNGVPLGEEYILYMRRYQASKAATSDKISIEVKKEEGTAVEELARGGWIDPVKVIALQRRDRCKIKRYTIVNAAKYNKQREGIELEAVQNFHDEFELEQTTIGTNSHAGISEEENGINPTKPARG